MILTEVESGYQAGVDAQNYFKTTEEFLKFIEKKSKKFLYWAGMATPEQDHSLFYAAPNPAEGYKYFSPRIPASIEEINSVRERLKLCLKKGKHTFNSVANDVGIAHQTIRMIDKGRGQQLKGTIEKLDTYLTTQGY